MKKKLKSYTAGAALGLIASTAMLAIVPAHSADEHPYYSSQQEADVDYARALHGTTLTTEQMQEQMAAVENAGARLNSMQMGGSSSQVRMAKEALHNAESMLTGTMSRMSGVSPEDIDAMHDSGMSWGELGREIGLRPGGRADRSNMSAGNTQMGQSGNVRQGDTPTAAMQSGSTAGTMRGGNSAVPQGYAGTGGLSPFAHDSENAAAVSKDPGRMMDDTNISGSSSESIQGMGISGQEMDAATARNMTDGRASGHGTNVNSGLDHQSGAMMGGTGGLDNGMPAGHGAGGGEGGMGGSGGGMGGSGGGMGGSGGGTGGSGGGMGGSGGGMGGSGGGMGGSGGGGMR